MKKKLDMKSVPKPAEKHERRIAPPALPLRHDHNSSHVEEINHPEVRLVVKTRYMEQKPHVLLIESVLLSSIIVVFFGVLLYELRVDISILLPVLLPIWLCSVILSYKFFEG